MIEKLEWDSRLFGKKMGVIKPDSFSRASINGDLDLARNEGYEYLVCRLDRQETLAVKSLEDSGFYLSDVGVTWGVDTDEYLRLWSGKKFDAESSVKEASLDDIPSLQEMIVSLFPDSRFYSDPFFTREDADRLHVAWIENSVKGEAADAVFHVPEKGFITCRGSSGRSGSIILVGVREGFRGKSLGSALTVRAMKWFQSRGVSFVKVKTQLKNVKAMNFYRRNGFLIHNFDMTFAIMLNNNGHTSKTAEVDGE